MLQIVGGPVGGWVGGGGGGEGLVGILMSEALSFAESRRQKEKRRHIIQLRAKRPKNLQTNCFCW
jgi:hypothetical protein